MDWDNDGPKVADAHQFQLMRAFCQCVGPFVRTCEPQFPNCIYPLSDGRDAKCLFQVLILNPDTVTRLAADKLVGTVDAACKTSLLRVAKSQGRLLIMSKEEMTTIRRLVPKFHNREFGKRSSRFVDDHELTQRQIWRKALQRNKCFKSTLTREPVLMHNVVHDGSAHCRM